MKADELAYGSRGRASEPDGNAAGSAILAIPGPSHPVPPEGVFRAQGTVDMPCLVPCFSAMLVDRHSGKTYPLRNGDSFLVGRTEGCSIVLDDPSTSRIHARIWSERGACFAEDLGSTNGTFLNGRRIASFERVSVPFGSIARFGASFLWIEEGNRRHCAKDGVPMGCARDDPAGSWVEEESVGPLAEDLLQGGTSAPSPRDVPLGGLGVSGRPVMQAPSPPQAGEFPKTLPRVPMQSGCRLEDEKTER